MLIVLGLAGIGGGGAALAKELTRKATKAEVATALGREIATRWQRLPAGTIFPARISYLNAEGYPATATLVGIAPRATCRASLEPSAYSAIRAFGCVAMLRATYLDATGTLAATIGVGVMASPSAASRAQQILSPISAAAGLYAVPFTGTLAGAFGNGQRGAAGIEALGPYIFLYTAGYSDGRPGTAAQSDPKLGSLGSGILAAAEKVLTDHGNPCTMKDIQC